MKRALLYIFLFLAVQIGVGIIAQVIIHFCMDDVELMQSNVQLTITAVSAVLLFAIFLGFKFFRPSRDYVRSRPWMAFLWTACLALGIIIPLACLETLIPEELRVDYNAELLTDIMRINDGFTILHPGYIVVCMLVPLMEEMIFRGAILEALLKAPSLKGKGRGKDCEHSDSAFCTTTKAPTGVSGSLPTGEGGGRGRGRVALAIVISALFFAAAHLNPGQIPHAFLVGLLLGWLYVNTRSIVLCFIVHWINNSTAFVLINAFPTIPVDSDISAYVGGDTTAVVKAIIFSLMMALPAIYQLHKEFKRKFSLS